MNFIPKWGRSANELVGPSITSPSNSPVALLTSSTGSVVFYSCLSSSLASALASVPPAAQLGLGVWQGFVSRQHLSACSSGSSVCVKCACLPAAACLGVGLVLELEVPCACAWATVEAGKPSNRPSTSKGDS